MAAAPPYSLWLLCPVEKGDDVPAGAGVVGLKAPGAALLVLPFPTAAWRGQRIGLPGKLLSGTAIPPKTYKNSCVYSAELLSAFFGDLSTLAIPVQGNFLSCFLQE